MKTFTIYRMVFISRHAIFTVHIFIYSQIIVKSLIHFSVLLGILLILKVKLFKSIKDAIKNTVTFSKGPIIIEMNKIIYTSEKTVQFCDGVAGQAADKPAQTPS